MTLDLGAGLPLKDASPWLRNDAERHARILRVAEINSVIEGLPPFQEETRQRIAEELAVMAAGPLPGPNGSPPASGDSSS